MYNRCVRDHVEELIVRLAEHQRLHGEAHYYEVRSLACPQDASQKDWC